MQVALELRQKYPLDALLKLADLARSSFYYQCRVLRKEDKYAPLKECIRAIYEKHKGSYGYRRITLTIKQLGKIVNHKTIQRLMGEMGLKSLVRAKKYKSYKGNVGRVAPNILQR